MRFLTVLLLLAACGEPEALPDMLDAPADVPATKAPERLDIPADAPKVAFLGDSIAAGLHLARDEAFPALLQSRLLLQTCFCPGYILLRYVSGTEALVLHRA